MKHFPLLCGLLFPLLVVEASEARHAYFSQLCDFTVDGKTYRTEQSYFGEDFRLEHVWAEYIAKDAPAAPNGDPAEISVSLLSRKDTPTEQLGADEDFTTTGFSRDEQIVIRSLTPSAKAALPLKLVPGQILDLKCKVEIDEPNWCLCCFYVRA